MQQRAVAAEERHGERAHDDAEPAAVDVDRRGEGHGAAVRRDVGVAVRRHGAHVAVLRGDDAGDVAAQHHVLVEQLAADRAVEIAELEKDIDAGGKQQELLDETLKLLKKQLIKKQRLKTLFNRVTFFLSRPRKVAY